ncbi:MAG: hypothetical protein AAGN82_11940 [Myxococcota bacterium]
MQQLIQFLLLALLGAPHPRFEEAPRNAGPMTWDEVGLDERALEQGFDVDTFDFHPLDDETLNKKTGDGDLTDAIAQLRAIAKKRRARLMTPPRPPQRLLLEEGTYGERTTYDIYGRLTLED